jgi:murein DD-endopeptidase MepM/ murein hydrolase activator NlpD
VRAVAALACLAFAAAAAAEPPHPGGDWAFAPKDARPHPSTRYGLPFDPVFPRYLTYTDTHTGRNRHALDFVLPTGTPVWAAREGVVARVVDGFTEGGLDPALMNSANLVAVLHADGTFALYVHLSPGIPVKEGERVARGQVIGASGHTGFSSGPHLHFVVCRNGVDGVTSIPFRFGAPGTAGFVPKIGSYVGFPPRPTIELALYDASGKPIRPGVALPVRAGDETRIRVEARPTGAAARDVTGHPRLFLVSMTPWNLDVLGPGELAFRPMAQYAREWDVDLDVATVGVFFLNGEQREIGLGKVEFHFIDRIRKTPRAEAPRER